MSVEKCIQGITSIAPKTKHDFHMMPKDGMELEMVMVMVMLYDDAAGVCESDDERDGDDVIGIEPNTVTYSLVLQAWAMCAQDNRDAAEKAEQIVFKMMDLHDEGVDVKANSKSFTT